ncbi:hypothetical protein EPN18_08180 [bacterium]|nr:MAG: hypothetical protein EPN18_08180 [bacterium]
MTMSTNIIRDMSQKTALKYGLKDTKEEKKLFEVCWKWRKETDEIVKKEDDAMHTEVARQFGLFANRVNETGHVRPDSQELGHRYIHKEDLTGKKYVIFSDHHWMDNANRQNYFKQNRNKQNNKDLYVQVLRKYLQKEYTLIENGDVEDLIVFEPTMEEIEARAGMNQQQLKQRRVTSRGLAFDKIVEDNRDLYTMLSQFHRENRFLKIAGNHDYNLQDGTPLAHLQNKFPGINAPYDYVLLTNNNKVEYAILHGHQFDTSTNPVYAPRIGETISESLGWAYQGADRTWAWNDDCQKWATANGPFRNVAVTDTYKETNWLETAIDGAGLLIGNLHSKDAWESLFKHNIAWEYFENTDPEKAYQLEVKTGNEFFKIRHLNEENIIKWHNACFTDAATRPKLVLGHSHEVRAKPLYNNENYKWYYNTGSAGRFENLIWGLEIVNGVATVISWSFPRLYSGEPERRVYGPDQQAPKKKIMASANPVDL